MTNNTKSYFPSIDIIKAICIIMVITTHLISVPVICKACLWPFTIDMAVPLFMIISGFNNANSFTSNNISLLSAYNFKRILGIVKKLTIPFTILFILEILRIIHTHTILQVSYLRFFFEGADGPGSYYYPVMLKFIFCFPVIYWLIKRYKLTGLTIVVLLNLIAEIYVSKYGIINADYRLMFSRYLAFVGCGTYYALHPATVRKITLTISTILGIAYILAMNYFGYTLPIFKLWTVTSMPTCLYIFPVFVCVFNKLNTLNQYNALLLLIGKASWHIFLVQQFYYWYPDAPNWTTNLNNLPLSIHLLVNIAICVTAGIVFYKTERFVTQKLKLKREAN